MNNELKKKLAEQILNFTICGNDDSFVEELEEGRYSKWGGGAAYLIDFRTNGNYQTNLRESIKELDFIKDVKIVEVEKDYMRIEIYTKEQKCEKILVNVDDKDYNFILVEWEE